jgi:curved DNA-binding protein CbpA
LAFGFYELLQLPPTATEQQLRQSFRRLSKRYHPDTTTLPAPVAAEAFQRLRRAYGVLSDPQSRRLYDERLRLTAIPAPQPCGQATAAGLARGAPVSLRRALSGGEWFALLLLAVALLLSLVLGLGVAWARGAEMVRWPSWWTDLHPVSLAMAEPIRAEQPIPAEKSDREAEADREDGLAIGEGLDQDDASNPGAGADQGGGAVLGNGKVERPQSSPLTADASHVPAP